eukprot:3461776-Rhodomonas_salina.3
MLSQTQCAMISQTQCAMISQTERAMIFQTQSGVTSRQRRREKSLGQTLEFVAKACDPSRQPSDAEARGWVLSLIVPSSG